MRIGADARLYHDPDGREFLVSSDGVDYAAVNDWMTETLLA
ncbi:hypothetical protein [Nocardia sp. alder85J]|nr:hypothetical protein [Nocardia sp. alder85J]MCX4097925.1 hypothetical protein [Nocardia sp. alder85J]